jgi:hypothetical protein
MTSRQTVGKEVCNIQSYSARYAQQTQHKVTNTSHVIDDTE